LPKSLKTYNRLSRDLSNLESIYYAGNCSDFFKITFNDSFTYWSPNAKIYLENQLILKDLEIPDGVTKIPYGLFENYKALESVKIPASVTTIDSRAFYQSGVKTAIINGNITGTSVFASCANLQTVYINKTITGANTFQGVMSLEKVYIGENVTGFGTWDFFMTGGIKEVWFDGNIQIEDTSCCSREDNCSESTAVNNDDR
jgi:hypothetical protein